VFPAIDIAKLLKALLQALLNPKTWIYIVGLAAIIWGSVKVYNFIFTRGENHQISILQPKLDAVTKERDTALADFKAYKDEYDEWMALSSRAKDQFIKEQAAQIDALTADLNAARVKADAQQKIIIHEIPKYIPADVDNSTILPIGAVRLYADALQDGAANDAALGPISFGSAGNVGEPSGVTLSQFIEIASSNAVQCVRDRATLKSWQTWYPQSKASYERALQVQTDNAPTHP
jgi:hypothetical protein